jgi:ribosome-associated protein
MLRVSDQIRIPEAELRFSAIRAQGAGGQNVNKVASAVHDRVTKQGIIIIKAQRFRTRERNRQDALDRLKQLILAAVAVKKKRLPSRPSAASGEKRLARKSWHGKLKKSRNKVSENDDL